MSARKINILITGVGGQGLITIAKLIGEASVKCGTNVIIAETRGLSQRGGSVNVFLRLGNVNAPLFGKADIIIGLELLEIIRNIKYVKENTMIIANKNIIKPNIPDIRIPTLNETLDFLNKLPSRIYLVNATNIAMESGNPRSVNMAMLGFTAGLNILKPFISKECIIEAFKYSKYAKYESNIKSFNEGFSEAIKLKS